MSKMNIISNRYEILNNWSNGYNEQINKVKDYNEFFQPKTIKRFQDLNNEQIRFVEKHANLIKNLKNENIIKYLDDIMVDNIRFILTPYYEDSTLALYLDDLKQRNQTIKTDVLNNWCKGLLNGINDLHLNSIVHNNIQPKNIFVKNESLIIGDITYFVSRNNFQDEGITYYAPEILKNQDSGNKKDIWSFGCVLYEMTKLEKLFGEAESLEKAANVIHKISNFNEDSLNLSDINYLFKKLIEKSIVVNPEERYSAKQLIGELQRKLEVLKTIGEGSFGIVYLVEDKLDKRKYALKSIPENKTHQGSYREIKVLIKLDNELFVKYYDSYCREGFFFIIMEYCNGGSLEEIILSKKNSEQSLSYENIEYWSKLIICGMHILHSKEIMHRDIKPKNLLLVKKNGSKPFDDIKFCDFGISRILDDETLTTDQGTLDYMSPEMANKEKNYDYKTDVWSSGCVIYELITLEKYSSSDYKHNVKDLSNFNTSHFLLSLLKKMLKTNRLERSTSHDLYEDIQDSLPTNLKGRSRPIIDLNELVSKAAFALFKPNSCLLESKNYVSGSVEFDFLGYKCIGSFKMQNLLSVIETLFTPKNGIFDGEFNCPGLFNYTGKSVGLKSRDGAIENAIMDFFYQALAENVLSYEELYDFAFESNTRRRFTR